MSESRRTVRAAGAEHEIQVVEYLPANRERPARLKALLNDETFDVEIHEASPTRVRLTIEGRSQVISLAKLSGKWHASSGGCHAYIEPLGKDRASGEAPPGEVTPPMPAVVVAVLVESGQKVERGQGLVVVSAMKMETTLVAPVTGTVTGVKVAEGDKVNPGQILVDVESAEDEED